ncbi:hypothetical protein NDU88_010897 [Pleurodeles waltl]|uniref:Uncharacterized protein n=1 Tax=Pleurodeles waltl TaxID=8319 RepID=A0AAV7S4K9_PLEWA|nr:hypothetical protein NDU88_010897 [Pleurodeles waltl]
MSGVAQTSTGTCLRALEALTRHGPRGSLMREVGGQRGMACTSHCELGVHGYRGALQVQRSTGLAATTTTCAAYG